MSDDTRQARIEAAMAAYDAVIDEAFERNTPNGKGFRQAIAAALDAADAVGRERVSVAEAEAMLDRYFTNRFEAIVADGQHLAIGFLEQAESERTHLIALLVAAPAEPSMTKLDKDAEAAIEAARNLLLHLHLETMTGATLTTPAVQELMTALDDAIFAWDESKPPQDDESRWHVWTPERGHDETGGEAMTRQRTSAEIEAGARALYQNRSQTRWAWEELEPKQREHFLAVAQDTLAAADAAAAPAVGVTVDEAEQLVDELLAMYRRTGYGFTKRRVFTAFEKQRANVIALLTAQPEPGTPDAKGAG